MKARNSNGGDGPWRRRATTFVVITATVLTLGGVFLVLNAGAAAADGLDATPKPPAVIDLDGTHNYDTSSFPASPTWPAQSTWGAS